MVFSADDGKDLLTDTHIQMYRHRQTDRHIHRQTDRQTDDQDRSLSDEDD